MARTARSEVFSHSEICCVHTISKTVRGCYLMGRDNSTGESYEHRKSWIEEKLLHCAAIFGIDLIAFAILDNHYHCVLRNRPDIVASWDDREVARRWLRLCPVRRNKHGVPVEPTNEEIDLLCRKHDRIKVIRERLSDISWWMRMVNQPIAVRANREDKQEGKFWRSRYRSIRLLDEASVLACAVYVDLNVIRAAMSETIEESKYTSARRRALALRSKVGKSDRNSGGIDANRTPPDAALAPVPIHQQSEPSPQGIQSSCRASDKGFAPMSTAGYLELLDWTARQQAHGKAGVTPGELPALFARLGISDATWRALTSGFEDLFCQVAGQPKVVDSCCSRLEKHRFYMPTSSRELFSAG